MYALMLKRPINICLEDEAEWKRLRGAYVVAAKNAIDSLRAHGPASQNFREADLEVRAVAQRIKEILDRNGKPPDRAAVNAPEAAKAKQA
jgi:hypothetical protein